MAQRPKSKAFPPVETMRELFSYNRMSGILTWRERPRSHFTSDSAWKTWNKKHVGKPVGGRNSSGYLQAQITVFIDYQDTTETIAMRAEMQAVNNALGSASITVAGGPSSIPPFMTRRFQIDSPDAPHTFHQHGRLYGGLWQSLPKTERHLLRVEGEQVADLDFTGMFVQLAYLEAGLALPNSDPYVGVEGLPRTAMKLGISALLCRSGAMRRLPTEISDIVGSKWNARRFSAALAERHPSIAHLFGKGLGLRLMKIEGDILLVALQELFAQGVPALPMHDGIMVPASKSEAARRAMARASMKIVGVALPVAQKAVLPDAENANSPPME